MAYDGDIHVNAALSNYVRGIACGDPVSDFIAPRVEVPGDKGTYFTFSNDAKVEENFSGPHPSGVPYPSVDEKMGKEQFEIEYHGLSSVIPYRDIDTAGVSLDLEMSRSRSLASKLSVQREVSAADKFFNAGNYTIGNTAAVGTKWNTSGGDPKKDIDAAAEVIFSKCGAYPNAILFGSAAWSKGVAQTFRLPNILAGGGLSSDEMRSLRPDEYAHFFWWGMSSMIATATKTADRNNLGGNAVYPPTSCLIFVRDLAQVEFAEAVSGDVGLGRTFVRSGANGDTMIHRYENQNPPGVHLVADLGWAWEMNQRCGYLLTACV